MQVCASTTHTVPDCDARIPVKIGPGNWTPHKVRGVRSGWFGYGRTVDHKAVSQEGEAGIGGSGQKRSAVKRPPRGVLSDRGATFGREGSHPRRIGHGVLPLVRAKPDNVRRD